MLKKNKHLLLFLDYDGTLTPIVKDPKLAKPTPARKRFLTRLARHRDIRLALISGRQLSDLKRMIRLPGIHYAGSHGLEIEGPGIKYIHPVAAKTSPLMIRLRKELVKNLCGIPGLILGNKIYTLSVHYRVVPPKYFPRLKKIFFKTVAPYVTQKAVKITHGKKVFEVRPNVNWDKGKAVLWLMNKMGPGSPVYVGDDITDEDAFRALKGRGLTYKVGRSKKTQAKYTLPNIPAVYEILRLII